MLRRLLDLLKQHIRGTFQHTIHVFDDDDAPRCGTRHLLGHGDQLTHLIDTNSHLVSGKNTHIRMRSGQHLTGNPRRLGIKTMIGTLQRRRKGTRQIRTPRPRRAANQPRLRKLGRVSRRNRRQHVAYRLLPDNALPNTHERIPLKTGTSKRLQQPHEILTNGLPYLLHGT